LRDDGGGGFGGGRCGCKGEAPEQEAAPQRAPSASSSQSAGTDRARGHIVAGRQPAGGLWVAAEQAYPPRLEAALRARGMNAFVVNAGVSGDTTPTAARDRLYAGSTTPDLVLLSLGGNDMLRGLSPAQTRANLEAILAKLDQRMMKVVLLGMMAAPNMGPIMPGL
jgi:acyl-CoA thioesterase-1